MAAYFMSMSHYKALREIENIILERERKVCRRVDHGHNVMLRDMVSRMSEARSAEPRYINMHSGGYPWLEAPSTALRGIAFPEALTMRDLAEIVGILGDTYTFFRTEFVFPYNIRNDVVELKKLFNDLLDRLPGGHDLVMLGSETYRTQTLMRIDKVPTAFVLDLKSLYILNRDDVNAFAYKMGDPNKVVEGNHDLFVDDRFSSNRILAYFESEEDYVFAKLKYS